MAIVPGIILVIFAILIGISRIYVGVHWPSDVLGGWLLAGMWLPFASALYTVARAKWCYQKRPKSSPNNNKRSCLSGIYQRGFTTETKYMPLRALRTSLLCSKGELNKRMKKAQIPCVKTNEQGWGS